MKLTVILSRIAALGVIAAAGLTFNALALFAAIASAFVVLIARNDYAPRDYAGARPPVSRREAMPLAA